MSLKYSIIALFAVSFGLQAGDLWDMLPHFGGANEKFEKRILELNKREKPSPIDGLHSTETLKPASVNDANLGTGSAEGEKYFNWERFEQLKERYYSGRFYDLKKLFELFRSCIEAMRLERFGYPKHTDSKEPKTRAAETVKKPDILTAPGGPGKPSDTGSDTDQQQSDSDGSEEEEEKRSLVSMLFSGIKKAVDYFRTKNSPPAGGEAGGGATGAINRELLDQLAAQDQAVRTSSDSYEPDVIFGTHETWDPELTRRTITECESYSPAIMDLILKLFSGTTCPKTFLDMGAGPDGGILNYLDKMLLNSIRTQKNLEISLCEPNEKSFEELKAKFPSITVLNIPAESLYRTGHKYDLIYLSNVFDCILVKGDQAGIATLQSLKRSLSPKGSIVLDHYYQPCRNFIFQWLERFSRENPDLNFLPVSTENFEFGGVKFPNMGLLLIPKDCLTEGSLISFLIESYARKSNIDPQNFLNLFNKNPSMLVRKALNGIIAVSLAPDFNILPLERRSFSAIYAETVTRLANECGFDVHHNPSYEISTVNANENNRALIRSPWLEARAAAGTNYFNKCTLLYWRFQLVPKVPNTGNQEAGGDAGGGARAAARPPDAPWTAQVANFYQDIAQRSRFPTVRMCTFKEVQTIAPKVFANAHFQATHLGYREMAMKEEWILGDGFTMTQLWNPMIEKIVAVVTISPGHSFSTAMEQLVQSQRPLIMDCRMAADLAILLAAEIKYGEEGVDFTRIVERILRHRDIGIKTEFSSFVALFCPYEASAIPEPGDFVGIKGHPKYLERHPHGSCQADNTFMVGADQFVGYGPYLSKARTQEEVQRLLAKEYASVPSEISMRAIRDLGYAVGNVPDIDENEAFGDIRQLRTPLVVSRLTTAIQASHNFRKHGNIELEMARQFTAQRPDLHDHFYRTVIDLYTSAIEFLGANFDPSGEADDSERLALWRDAMNNRALAHLENQDFAAAMADANTVLRRLPDNPRAQERKAAIEAAMRAKRVDGK